MAKAREEKSTAREKLSPGFVARLERLGPEERVRAIIVLETGNARRALGKRLTKTTRRAAVKDTRQSVAGALPAIDRILKLHHGKRLKSGINALGAVPVITTPAGINALTNSEHVKAIFEDQAIYSVI